RALGPGYRAVVDQRGLLPATVAHVPVHRVEAGVHHPVCEPPVERRLRSVEHHGWRLVPVDVRGRVTPEPLGVGQAPPELLLISAHHDTPSTRNRYQSTHPPG